MTFLPCLAPEALRFLVGGRSVSIAFPSESTSFLASALPRGCAAAFGFAANRLPSVSVAGVLPRDLREVGALAFAFGFPSAVAPAAGLSPPKRLRRLLCLLLWSCQCCV